MSPEDGRATVPAKATLFCPGCGRQGSALGDWPERVDREADACTLYCPDCGASLTSRPHTGTAGRCTRHPGHAAADD